MILAIIVIGAGDRESVRVGSAGGHVTRVEGAGPGGYGGRGDRVVGARGDVVVRPLHGVVDADDYGDAVGRVPRCPARVTGSGKN